MVDRLIDDYELSRRIGRARSTIQKDRVRGCSLIPYVRVGGRVKYRESDVVAYLASLPLRRSTSEAEHCPRT
jgi:hypothetical protein